MKDAQFKKVTKLKKMQKYTRKLLTKYIKRL